MAADDPSRSDADARRARLVDDFVARLAPSASNETERLDRATARLFPALERARAGAPLLKGPALAHAPCRAGERRAYVDVDVLVAPADRATARRVLAGLGYFDAH